jgi:hypothetical protein
MKGILTMKRLILSVVGIVSVHFSLMAHAVNLSQDGTGQVLLYPYYNVNQGNITFVSVTNTENVAKAVKVRIREAVGGERVFDFTLYLSPRDVWVGALTRQGDAIRVSVPADTTCSVPERSVLTAMDFSTDRISDSYDPDESGSQSTSEVLERISEGYIEVFELAELPTTDGAKDIADAITHNRYSSTGAPEDCSVPVLFNETTGLGAILDSGTVSAGGVSQDFQPPGGGLYGSAAIFNSASGIYFPYNASALRRFASNPIWWPQNSDVFSHVEGVATAGEDSAGNAISNYTTADSGSTVPSAGGTLNRDLPDLSTPSVSEVTADSSAYTAFTHVAASDEQAINSGSFGGSVPNASFDKASAVSAALTGNRIMGDYITSDSYGTDWVVTFPTRYTKVSDTEVNPPFYSSETVATGKACAFLLIDSWDREEKKNYDVFFWLPPNTASMCHAVNVLSASNEVNGYSEVLSSKVVQYTLPLDLADGWGYIDMSAYSTTPTVFNAGDASGAISGLPVLGFVAVADRVSGVERGGVFPLRVTFDEQ